MNTMRAPGHRAGLTHGAVVATARELLLESGLDGLTMRALARRLDVAPNALYSHVANKTELLDEVLDELLAAVAAPELRTGDPSTELAKLLSSTYEMLTCSPQLVGLYLTRQGAQGPHAVRLGEAMDALLTESGVRSVADARRALIIHTIGSAAFATSAPADPPGRRMSEVEARHLFERSLRWLLAGITQDLGDRRASG